MRSYIGSLSLVFALTACAPLSKHDSFSAMPVKRQSSKSNTIPGFNRSHQSSGQGKY